MNIVVVGGTGGIGKPISKFLSERGDTIYSISRKKPLIGNWIQKDISDKESFGEISKALKGIEVDALLFLAGTWEKNAFTNMYSFLETSIEENSRVLDINLKAPILTVHSILPNLLQAKNPKVVFIGALSGLDHFGSKEVANTASKFGLIGAVQALHQELKSKRIGFSVINPGNIATEEVIDDIKSGTFSEQTPIPLSDLIKTIEFLLSISSSCAVTEINLEQMV